MSFSHWRTRHPATRPIVLALVGALNAIAASGAQQSASPDRLRLGDLYAQVERANPRIAAANALATAAQARVPGTRRPPDPQLQLGFMNYTLPGLPPSGSICMSWSWAMPSVGIGARLGSG